MLGTVPPCFETDKIFWSTFLFIMTLLVLLLFFVCLFFSGGGGHLACSTPRLSFFVFLHLPWYSFLDGGCLCLVYLVYQLVYPRFTISGSKTHI